MRIINSMKTHYNDWLLQYQANKPDPYKSLLHLFQSFAHRHRFSQRVDCHSKLPAVDMVKYDWHNLRDIINVTEKAFPILFIFHGTPGGPIDQCELRTYPSGHHYAVQNKGWMNSRVWRLYLDVLPSGQMSSLQTTFDAHVSQQSSDSIVRVESFTD
ncbi:hypothetical protein H257_14830 [Aphanomyces astaci]|uniref:DDE-1 domain-containing protein n=1 Tax=Aphanomyces astaci TaxID=112090 RepID=W4FPR9_APHAT|nr:hypothetical protein H257_14830 [Aphanomyces astaci]ETV69460.1 hypothetical protein H257_14830 [Aphanomyces astaci]|eukprot:XP_009841033.1 hypothetical protein H257_14830 [Aphanomyces astaci]